MNYDSMNKLLSIDCLTSNTGFNEKLHFHKKHLVGKRLSCANSIREEISSNYGKTSSRPAKHLNTFVPSFPSIPKIHVPRTVLKRMVETQYFGTSLPRHNTLY